MLRESERRTAEAGHENDGFLSWSHGFVPKNTPLRRLAPKFAAWDEVAAELPTLYRDLSLRRRVEQLPLLDASNSSLEDREVLRACALLAILAQAYWYVELEPPEVLPEVIKKPWAQLRGRLGREQEVLSYIDLIVYNWRVVDASLPEPLLVDNLRLLLPTVDNREEHVFYLTQLEILAKASPLVRLVTLAQDAVLVGDQEGLEEALLGVISLLTQIVRTSLPKINPSPFGVTHVDPVVWAKTVAPFAVPIRMGDQGPSGTSSPLFNTLDLFFGRRDYGSFLGREIRQLRATYPPAWRAFLEAIGRVSVADYIERTGSKTLAGAWREAFELYVGPSGFLGRHRMKVYGYLELAFKVGRSVTIGGFGGVFKDRTWDQVDNELDASQRERLRGFPGSCPEARVQSQAAGSCPVPGGVRHLTLDVSRAGVRYGVGDRCIIFPENSPELVAVTLRVLAARGDERVALTDEWREAGKVRRELAGKAELAVRDVLRFGCIRPVTPRIAEALHARTQSGLLLEQLQRCCTERWELWELIELLREDGLNPVDLWSEAGVKVSERLCRIIPPERFRVYSIASAAPSPLGKPAASIDLIVGHLRYPGASDALAALNRARVGTARPSGCPATSAGGAAAGVMREGTASSFLARAEREQSSFPFRIERPARFQLPPDPRTPIIFFAGGTGVSPFLGFLQERLRSVAGGPCWLFWSLRTRQDFVCEAELGPALRAGVLELDVCFTRESAEVDVDPAGQLRVREGSARRIAELMRAPEAACRLWQLLGADPCVGATVYVCGRSGFARSVLDGLKSVFREFATGSDSERAEQANEILYRLVANNRLLLEIHTDAQPADDEPRWIDASEIAEHNGDGAGYWMIIDRVVYDLTEFMELHPGGRRVVQAYAGLDATHGYARAHHQRPEVDAMREMYRIGMVRALEFDDYTTQVDGPSGPYTVSCRTAHVAWVQALQLVVEMQNALRADYSLQHCVTTSGEAAEELGRYKLSRAAETHCRFLEHYQRVLEEETLPSLWRISQGLFAPEVSPDWMSQELARIKACGLGQEMRGLAHQIFEHFTEFAADLPRLQRMVATFEAADLRMLAELKSVLANGVRVFERHQRRTRLCGSAELCATSRALVDVLEQSASSLAAAMGTNLRDVAPPAETAAVCAPAVKVARRLFSSVHWIFEERSDESLAILRRTPVAWTSLAQLSEENEAILRSLGEHQRSQGLLVDMREAPIRNDADFENAMAKLRQGLANHFKRIAILLESNLGELQVTRIERDERRNALATRSESSALKFLLGGK